MVKIVTALVVLLLGLGVYFVIFQKGESPIALPVTNQEVLSTSAEDDLTALEKDLAELENDEAIFTEELNKL